MNKTVSGVMASQIKPTFTIYTEINKILCFICADSC